MATAANPINTLAFVAAVHALRREPAAARQLAEATMEMSAEQRTPWFLAYGTVLHGWAQAALDQGEDGTFTAISWMDRRRRDRLI